MAEGIIHIDKISVEGLNGRTRLIFDVTENGQTKQTFFETEEKYGEYLCHERCDAIVIGLLSYAMRNGYDMKSNVPVTEELLYNLNEYLIPGLTKYDAKLTAIKIDVPTAEAVTNVGAIGTGLSCGVDSFHTILSHTNTPYKNRNLTHLVINNVGAFNDCYGDAGIEKVKKDCYERARKVAKELNLPLIEANSDFQTAFSQNHLLTHTYSSVFAVYCLQKLWKIFYYASAGYDMEHFELENNSDNPPCHYELLSLNCFSTDKLRIYSGGAASNRLEKVKRIADNKIAQENLHVCTSKSYNCGRCGKCKRTILELYALGKLENFSKVFDVEDFRKNKSSYLIWLSWHNDEMNGPIYRVLKHEMGVLTKLVGKIRQKYIEPYVFEAVRKNDTTRRIARSLKLKIMGSKPKP